MMDIIINKIIEENDAAAFLGAHLYVTGPPFYYSEKPYLDEKDENQLDLMLDIFRAIRFLNFKNFPGAIGNPDAPITLEQLKLAIFIAEAVLKEIEQDLHTFKVIANCTFDDLVSCHKKLKLLEKQAE